MGRSSIYHGKEIRYSMDIGFKILWIVGLKYHGYGFLYAMSRG
jgi:hypothetical protein